ncbi:MAG TPA: 2-succinyl-5-enolpyruvyl-6-hydroxy-3-cyclohexene-1-carboxylic-acid synthase, partial [Opitutales bacterium]|nr:2-succinyl-5-enolpyruvyl-6-hydroxy-3-cyclohexene-1-carboxylic-acid synthase [Opitutales bacterium]
LGVAKRIRWPVVLVCTSGTAAANFFPAVIEARESRVPLLVLTADRPPEMRDCASGQTIDQVKIFGDYPRWQAELALPEASLKLFKYLRQTLSHACERTLFSVSGPVHLNVPFRDPLAPISDGSLTNFDREELFRLLEPVRTVEMRAVLPSEKEVRELVKLLETKKRPLIVAGPADPADADRYVRAVSALAKRIGAPILADVLSPLRQRGAAPAVIDHYDALLARKEIPEPLPDLVLRFGPLPTSKRLREWLEKLDATQIVVDESDRNVDPLHSADFHLRADLGPLVESVLRKIEYEGDSSFANLWLDARNRVSSDLAGRFEQCDWMFEGKIARLLGEKAPAGTKIFISNSTPIRDAEFFFEKREEPVEIFFNRGANGIDGIVSTALGVASEGRSTILLTGELAFLHDQNGFFAKGALLGGLTVLLINNGGGGIFQSLPVAKIDPPFTEFFLTPHEVDFEKLCSVYEIGYAKISDWDELSDKIAEPWTEGVRVLEIGTDSKLDRDFRAKMLSGG